jgi:hypothetical protein
MIPLLILFFGITSRPKELIEQPSCHLRIESQHGQFLRNNETLRSRRIITAENWSQTESLNRYWGSVKGVTSLVAIRMENFVHTFL